MRDSENASRTAAEAAYAASLPSPRPPTTALILGVDAGAVNTAVSDGAAAAAPMTAAMLATDSRVGNTAAMDTTDASGGPHTLSSSTANAKRPAEDVQPPFGGKRHRPTGGPGTAGKAATAPGSVEPSPASSGSSTARSVTETPGGVKRKRDHHGKNGRPADVECNCGEDGRRNELQKQRPGPLGRPNHASSCPVKIWYQTINKKNG